MSNSIVSTFEEDAVAVPAGEPHECEHSLLAGGCQADEDGEKWLNRAFWRLIDFGNLPDNWDQEGARRIDVGAMSSALEQLRTFVRDGVSEPWLEPTPEGEVALTWENDRLVIELTIARGSGRALYYRDRDTNEFWEGPADRSPRSLGALLARFARA